MYKLLCHNKSVIHLVILNVPASVFFVCGMHVLMYTQVLTCFVPRYHALLIYSVCRKKKIPEHESPKDRHSPKNTPKQIEPELESTQMNGTVKQTSEERKVDSNYNSVNAEYQAPIEQPVEEKKEEVKKVKTPTHERR